MSALTLAFLGAGNIAGAIIRGLISNGFDAANITAADPGEEQLARLRELGIRVTSENVDALAGADVILICVKPNRVAEVARSIAPHLGETLPLVISVAAGVPASALAGWLGPRCPLIRCMPNTPATIGAGATALYGAAGVTDAHRAAAARIMGAIGSCVWVDSDAEIDIATALSGSGPAYFFYLMEVMEAAGVRLGLDQAACRALVLQTALGAARLILERDEAPATLREQVTSPGGTTQAAIERMEALGMASLVDAAVGAAHARAQELAREFG